MFKYYIGRKMFQNLNLSVNLKLIQFKLSCKEEMIQHL